MFESQENTLRIQALTGPAVEFAIVLLGVATAALLATQPLFTIYLIPAILLVLAFVNFNSFVYAMVFLLPWYPLPTIDLPVRDAFLFLRLVMFIGVCIIRYRSDQSLYEWLLGGKVKKFIFAFAAVAIISLFFSPFVVKLDALRALVRFFSYLAMFYAIAGWIRSRAQVCRVIRLLLISAIVVALFGFYQELIGGYSDAYLYLFEAEIPDWNGRIPSFLFHFNALAAYLNMLIAFAIAYLVGTSERSTRRLGWICLSTGAAAVYLSGSRGGLLALGGVLLWSLFFTWLSFPPSLAKLKRGMSALILAGLIVIVLVPRPSEQEQVMRLQEVDDFTELSRLALWATAAEMFFEHPIVGVGYGDYKALYTNYLPDIEADKMDAHNLYLQLLSETGILGFTFFMAPLAVLLWRSVGMLRQSDSFYRLIGLGTGGALLGMLIHGGVDYFFHVQTQVGGLFWLIIGLGLVVSEDWMGSKHFASRSQS